MICMLFNLSFCFFLFVYSLMYLFFLERKISKWAEGDCLKGIVGWLFVCLVGKGIDGWDK